MDPHEPDLLELFIRGRLVLRAIGPVSRTALKYSNVIGCERLVGPATDSVTCPKDLQRP
jgi:hypothetical protein